MVTRFECLKALAGFIGEAPVILGTGAVEEEWVSLRPEGRLRLALGSVTPVALGLALAQPKLPVVALDADGSVLINLASLVTLGQERPGNLKVFVLDNECYESIGGMPSATGTHCDLASMARAAGVERAVTTRTLEEFRRAAKAAMSEEALHFVVAKVEKGAKRLPQVPTDGIEMKYRFVRYLEARTGARVISPPTQEMPKELFREN